MTFGSPADSIDRAADTGIEPVSEAHDEKARTGRAGAPSRLWLAGCVALLAMVVVHWVNVPPERRFTPPTSPLDNVAGLNETKRLAWAFLWQARDVLPENSTYTIVAGDRDTEMSIYMLSLAVLTECRAVPTSYYSTPSVEAGATARFVLVYGCAAEPGNAVLVQRLDDGCVWERREP